MPDAPPAEGPGPASPDAILELAESVRTLADQVEVQNRALTAATSSFHSSLSVHRRATWLAVTALAFAIAAAVTVGHLQIQQVQTTQRVAEQRRSDEERRSCEAANEVRVAVVRAARVAVSRTATRVAGPGPADQEAAALIAIEVADAVAEDPALQPRACPES